MYSDKLNQEYNSFKESLKDPIKKKHKPIKEKFNLIGSIEITKDNPNKELVLYNILENQDMHLDGLYVHLNEIDYPNRDKDLELSFQLLLIHYSDIVIVKWHKYPNEFNVLSIYPFHCIDHVYLFDEKTEYESITVSNFFNNRKDRVIQNLSKDGYHAKRIYKDSIFVYSINDDSYEYKTKISGYEKPCVENMVKKDVFIPAYTFTEGFDIDKLHRVYNNSLEVFNIVNSFENEYDIELSHINENIFVNKDLELILYKVLLNSQYKDRWQEKYSGYDFSIFGDISIKNILESTIEVASIGYNFPELLIENLNGIKHKIIGKIDKITVLENSHHYQLSMNSNVKDVLALRMKNINYLNNVFDGVFTKIMPDRHDLPFGRKLYEQSIKYLYDNCDKDYLIVFNTKVILKSELLFDDSDVYCQMGDYIKIFNMKKLRELGIKFESFEDFEKKVQVKELDYKQKCILLPEDFDKYNGVMFLFARLRYKILKQYLNQHYGVDLVYDKFWNSR